MRRLRKSHRLVTNKKTGRPEYDLNDTCEMLCFAFSAYSRTQPFIDNTYRFRAPSMKAHASRQGTTSTTETSTTRTICIPCPGKRAQPGSCRANYVVILRDVLGSWKHYNLSRNTLEARTRRETSPLVSRELDR